MSVYKDKTFCMSYGSCINGHKCPDAATPDIFDAAEKFGLPVSMQEKFECYDEIKID